MLRRLSSEYVAQLRKSETPDCPPPWGELAVPTSEELAKKIDAAFG